MNQHQVFKRISEEKQRDYQRLARLEHGPDLVNESVRRWEGYSEAKKDAIIAEGNAIYANIAAAMEAGKTPDDDEVQRIFDRWQQHLRYFYEPTLDILRGLGETYALHPEFRANFEKLNPALPEFLHEGITYYVDELETEVLTWMMSQESEDEQRINRLRG